MEFPPLNFELQPFLLLRELIINASLHFSQLYLIFSHYLFYFISCHQVRGFPHKLLMHFFILLFYFKHPHFLILLLVSAHSFLLPRLMYLLLFVRSLSHGIDDLGRPKESTHFAFEVHVLVAPDRFEIFDSF